MPSLPRTLNLMPTRLWTFSHEEGPFARRRGFATILLVACLVIGAGLPAEAARKVRVRKGALRPPATGTPSTVPTTLPTVATTLPATTLPATTLPATTLPATILATVAPSTSISSAASGSAGVGVVGSAGTLISATPITGAPASTTGYKVRYQSVSPAGAAIEVTGLAYIPKSKAPSGGWPVLSYAHGTVGLADRCTPSNNISAIENTVAGAFAALGFAVVASDYEGLGTPGRHPYLVGVSEGRGVLDIVRAARQIPGASVSNRFVAWGHSQGGHAALFAGELAPTWAPDLKLLGVVAGAPPLQLTNVADSVSTSPFRGYLFMVAAGLQAADPNLDLSAVLTPKAQALLPVVDTGCNSQVFAAFGKDPFDSLIIREGLNRDPWKSALSANEPGKVKTDAPILIIHGDRDEQIPVETSATLKKKLCALGDSVERKVYPGQDHGGAALTSLFDVAAWLSQRVLGLPAISSC